MRVSLSNTGTARRVRPVPVPTLRCVWEWQDRAFLMVFLGTETAAMLPASVGVRAMPPTGHLPPLPGPSARVLSGWQ